MICELCGRAAERGYKVRIEGSTVNACEKCASLGEIVEEVSPKKRNAPTPIVQRHEAGGKREAVKVLDIEFDIVEDYAEKVRNAREKMGLKQADLAKMINEPESSIQRIEGGKFEPEIDVARKLEKNLGVRLVEKSAEPEDVKNTGEGLKELTLGDLIVLREKKKK